MDSKPEFSPLLSHEEDAPGMSVRRSTTRGWKSKIQPFLIATLSLSLILNIYMVFEHMSMTHKSMATEPTIYAHLSADLSIPWVKDDPYMDKNTTVADQAWEDIDINIGTVALDDAYTKELKLPAAQRFPWDEDKGIYLLAGFHDLHCLKTIRQWVAEVDRGLPLSEPAEHMFHCLDALRQSVMCYADDTPRYTDESHLSGIGQNRQCRSWGQLSDWAKQHSACWRFTGSHLNHTMSTKERYRFCPAESPYLARVMEEFGSP